MDFPARPRRPSLAPRGLPPIQSRPPRPPPHHPLHPPPPNPPPPVPPHLQLPHHRRRAAAAVPPARVLLMGGELDCASVVNHVLLRMHPFRRYIWTLCALCLLLALLIILNSVWIISVQSATPYRLGDPTFVIFSEVLAWLLILIAMIGLKMTCMASKATDRASASRRRPDPEGDAAAIRVIEPEDIGRQRPFSAPNWLWGGADQSGFGFDLPGATAAPPPPFDPFLFPAPPPRYSSLLDAPPQLGAVAHHRQLAAVAATASRRPSQTRRASHQFVRSPPPPYS